VLKKYVYTRAFKVNMLTYGNTTWHF